MSSLFENDEPKSGRTEPVKNGTPAVPLFDDSVVSIFDDDGDTARDEPYILSEAQPLSTAETVRTSGLAWSAAIALVGAVVVMLVIGWGADLLLGSSPWGIVIGIIIGAGIGFLQFFRITSEIFKK